MLCSELLRKKPGRHQNSVDNSCIFLFVIVSTRFFLYFVTTSRDCFFNKYPRVLFKTIRRWQNKLAWTRVFLPWKIRRCPRSGLLKIRFCLFSFSLIFSLQCRIKRVDSGSSANSIYNKNWQHCSLL